MKTLEDIKKTIYQSGLTECESRDCEDCEFDKRSSESKEFGFDLNICVMLNEVYKRI